ncbi:UDP-2,4-diacetamido-2,4,6-trideoxy-beta-L-altropyranose hydrolase [Natronomonas sp. F2-12]|uniref:UDP-2,4-diacetamido-2,4, 6-trideoxy-beta-L-altropyranose hydrolase n=1 Tax=Natronomonas aquatica TaxID=2841590 RepID=A0A9R1CRI7_9EURY|nr:UDP-2,4-diacetamido-2,4,6-trideoxy-beta-L-altropyranose hydrolase [Natronomonas aquatica]MCQ4333829.1 UDP-2,4-diacetamido-2,4,6-trideoxy-beta-L-altropyranose hydrolase [Natronomonas aquatica]
MHVVIRADGGPKIGYGHLVRSEALAEELLSRGYEVTVATTTPQPAETVFAADIETIKLPSRNDPTPFVKELETLLPDIVFTDAYPIDTKYQRTIRGHVSLAVFQDDARHAICTDLFVNGNLHAADLNYKFVEQIPKTCLGTDYVLLRREIQGRRNDDPPWRKRPQRAIVTMGGSDIARLTPTIVKAFDGVDLHVDAIIGPGCSVEHERNVRQAANDCSTDIHVIRDPNDLAERMFQADFAVSTASSTTYELLALGTPIVSIPVAENQQPIATALRSRDIATVLESEDGEEAFTNAIEEYINNTQLRRARRISGRKLVDGKGAKRIADAMIDVANR